MPSKKAQIEMLRAVPLFEGFSRRELGQIAAVAKEVSHRDAKSIVTEGTPGVGFHLIVEGKAKVTVGGRTKGTLKPGDYFGEISLLDSGPRLATVTATEPLKTLSIATWDFMPLLETNWKLAHKIIAGLCRLVRDQHRSAAM